MSLSLYIRESLKYLLTTNHDRQIFGGVALHFFGDVSGDTWYTRVQVHLYVIGVAVLNIFQRDIVEKREHIIGVHCRMEDIYLGNLSTTNCWNIIYYNPSIYLYRITTYVYIM